MDLETLVGHKANTKIMVNGNSYGIDAQCVCRDVEEADAAKLLQNSNWRPFDGTTSKKAKSGPQRAARMVQLVNGAGQVIEGQKEVKPDPEPTPEPEMRNEVAPEPFAPASSIQVLDCKPIGSEGSVPPPPPAENEAAAAEEPAAEEPAAKESGDPPIPEDGGQWPDPEPSYSMEWLRECADAYEVSYRKNIKAEKLVEKIMEAMYE